MQYSNECLLKIAQCEARNQGKPEPQIVPMGMCAPPAAPKKHNPNPMQQQCPDACPAVYDPVCAYDGATYMTFSNSCMLGIAACNARQKGAPVPVQVDNSFCNI
jgi:hypothetical protein